MALIVENTELNSSWVYNWGMFDYPSDSFLKDFIREQVRYKCLADNLYLDSYIKEDRDITIYTLNLDSKAKEIILTYAEENIKPENCYYDYHQFRDNCATRIRDIINMGTDGQFKTAFLNMPSRYTIRQHIRRYIWFRPLSDWFLDFLMGQNYDKKITKWDAMFLPVEIARNIVDFTYIDDSGVERKLVESIQVFNASKERPPILNKPIVTWPFALALGIIIAVLLFFIKYLHKLYPVCSRIFLGIIQSFFGLFFGGSGCVLVFGFLMNNDYFQQNINILFINPFLLIFIPLGILSAINKHFLIEPEKLMRKIWTCVFITCGITVILKILPFFYQQNQSVQGIFLPIAFALSHIPGLLVRKIKKRNV